MFVLQLTCFFMFCKPHIVTTVIRPLHCKMSLQVLIFRPNFYIFLLSFNCIMRQSQNYNHLSLVLKVVLILRFAVLFLFRPKINDFPHRLLSVLSIDLTWLEYIISHNFQWFQLEMPKCHSNKQIQNNIIELHKVI